MSIHKRAGRYWWWRRLEPNSSSYLYFDEPTKCTPEDVLKYASSEVGSSHADDHSEPDPEEGFE